MSYTVGLTGGIGCGKSTIANQFESLGIEIIDTDVYAQELVTPGSDAMAEIENHFGDAVIDEDGELDRQAMREIIFNKPAEKEWFEALLHPLILKAVDDRLQRVQSPYSIVVVPLLFEANLALRFDAILVVDCSEEEQIKRACLRDDSPPEEIKKIMQAQVSRDERLAAADDVIENSNMDEATMRERVKELHRKYSSLAD